MARSAHRRKYRRTVRDIDAREPFETRTSSYMTKFLFGYQLCNLFTPVAADLELCWAHESHLEEHKVSIRAVPFLDINFLPPFHYPFGWLFLCYVGPTYAYTSLCGEHTGLKLGCVFHVFLKKPANSTSNPYGLDGALGADVRPMWLHLRFKLMCNKWALVGWHAYQMVHTHTQHAHISSHIHVTKWSTFPSHLPSLDTRSPASKTESVSKKLCIEWAVNNIQNISFQLFAVT